MGESVVLGGIDNSAFMKDAFNTNFSTFKPPSQETSESESQEEEDESGQRKEKGTNIDNIALTFPLPPSQNLMTR